MRTAPIRVGINRIEAVGILLRKDCGSPRPVIRFSFLTLSQPRQIMNAIIPIEVNVSSLQPMDIFAMPRNPIPIHGTIPRCPHSIYAPDNGAAWSCRSCFPESPVKQRPIFLPVDSGTPLNRAEKMKANKSEQNSSACPTCGSRLHFGQGKTWECAECSTTFTAPKRKQSPECELAEVAA
jgi:ribosomal protein L37AE/L43A